MYGIFFMAFSLYNIEYFHRGRKITVPRIIISHTFCFVISILSAARQNQTASALWIAVTSRTFIFPSEFASARLKLN